MPSRSPWPTPSAVAALALALACASCPRADAPTRLERPQPPAEGVAAARVLFVDGTVDITPAQGDKFTAKPGIDLVGTDQLAATSPSAYVIVHLKNGHVVRLDDAAALAVADIVLASAPPTDAPVEEQLASLLEKSELSKVPLEEVRERAAAWRQMQRAAETVGAERASRQTEAEPETEADGAPAAAAAPPPAAPVDSAPPPDSPPAEEAMPPPKPVEDEAEKDAPARPKKAEAKSSSSEADKRARLAREVAKNDGVLKILGEPSGSGGSSNLFGASGTGESLEQALEGSRGLGISGTGVGGGGGATGGQGGRADIGTFGRSGTGGAGSGYGSGTSARGDEGRMGKKGGDKKRETFALKPDSPAPPGGPPPPPPPQAPPTTTPAPKGFAARFGATAKEAKPIAFPSTLPAPAELASCMAELHKTTPATKTLAQVDVVLEVKNGTVTRVSIRGALPPPKCAKAWLGRAVADVADGTLVITVPLAGDSR